MEDLVNIFGKRSFTGDLITAFWGNEKIYYNNYFTLSPVETYFYVITGKPYSTNIIGMSKIGNYLGSIDLGFIAAFDAGNLYYNSLGFLVSCSKSF